MRQGWAASTCEVLIGQERIRSRVRELGRVLTRDYRITEQGPVFVAVLRGAAVFHSDLIREVTLDLRVDFIAVASYGDSTRSSGVVRLTKDLDSSIRGEDVLLVEDIVDTGLTLSYLLRNLRSRKPRSLRVCSLLSKPSRRRVEVPVDYVGFEIPDSFVVGYGLDFNEKYRNLPHLAVLSSLRGEIGEAMQAKIRPRRTSL